MSSQRNYEVIDPIASVISCQDNGLVLPIVLFGVPVGTMLAHLTIQRTFGYNLSIIYLNKYSQDIYLCKLKTT